SDELGHVAFGNPCTVAAVCGFQDPYGICGLFLLCGDTRYRRTKDHEGNPPSRPASVHTILRKFGSVMLLLSMVWSCRSALKKSSSQPDMLQLRSMTARDFSLPRFSWLRLSQAIRDSPEMWLGIFLNLMPDAKNRRESPVGSVPPRRPHS